MIKKNTKVIFEIEDGEYIEDMVGGMPLSKDEIVHVHKNNSIVDYKVADKK